MDEKVFKKIYKKLIKRFVITSFLLLAVFLIKQIVLQYQIMQEENTSHIVNISGRQRMFSQKITKDILIIYEGSLFDNEESKEQEYYINDLKETLVNWETSHYDLKKLSEERNMFFYNNSNIYNMLTDIEPVLNNILINSENFLTEISSKNPDTENINNFIDNIIVNESIFLEKMDNIVKNYEADSEKSVQVIETSHIILFVIIILIIIFLILKIFIPLLKYLKKSFSDVNKNNENLIKIFNSIKGALFIVKRDGQIIFKNKDTEKIIIKKNIIQSHEHLFIDKVVNWNELDILGLINELNDEKQRTDDIETVVEDEEGNNLVFIVSATNVMYGAEEVILISMYDLTTQKKAEETIKNKVIIDGLTGLHNRHFLEEIIEEEIQRAKRYSSPLTASIMDIDYFKKINDNYGHPVGDQVLKFCADIIKENTRASDYVIRIGGEEFLILFPNTDIIKAYEASEKLRMAIEKANHEVVGKFTVSLGVAQLSAEEEYKDLYSRADKALYEAKQSGRNKVVISKKGENVQEIISVNWNPEWNCGEEIIDKQHREMFYTVSKLANSACFDNNKIKSLERIKEIINLVNEHFEYEEEILTKIKFKEAKMHKKIHEQLKEKAIELKEKVEKDEITCIKAFEIIFEEVVIEHLLREDVKFFPYLKSKN